MRSLEVARGRSGSCAGYPRGAPSNLVRDESRVWRLAQRSRGGGDVAAARFGRGGNWWRGCGRGTRGPAPEPGRRSAGRARSAGRLDSLGARALRLALLVGRDHSIVRLGLRVGLLGPVDLGLRAVLADLLLELRDRLRLLRDLGVVLGALVLEGLELVGEGLARVRGDGRRARARLRRRIVARRGTGPVYLRFGGALSFSASESATVIASRISSASRASAEREPVMTQSPSGSFDAAGGGPRRMRQSAGGAASTRRTGRTPRPAARRAAMVFCIRSVHTSVATMMIPRNRVFPQSIFSEGEGVLRGTALPLATPRQRCAFRRFVRKRVLV